MMSQDTILKSSIFGGYKKSDVTEYIDSILEENQKSNEVLKQKISSLEQENSSLKESIGPFAAERLAAAADNVAVKNEKQNYSPERPFAIKPSQALDADTREFRLPEGTYLVSKDSGIVSLPDPEPVYHVRKKGSLLDPADSLEDLTPSPEKKELNEIPGLATRMETKSNLQIHNSAARDVAQVEKSPVELPLPEKVSPPILKNEDQMEKLLYELPQQTSVCELQKKLEILENELNAERKEKQVLAAKLEYSTDLLLKLYQK